MVQYLKEFYFTTFCQEKDYLVMNIITSMSLDSFIPAILKIKSDILLLG